MDPPRIERGPLPCKGSILPLDNGPNVNICLFLFIFFSKIDVKVT